MTPAYFLECSRDQTRAMSDYTVNYGQAQHFKTFWRRKILCEKDLQKESLSL